MKHKKKSFVKSIKPYKRTLFFFLKFCSIFLVLIFMVQVLVAMEMEPSQGDNQKICKEDNQNISEADNKNTTKKNNQQFPVVVNKIIQLLSREVKLFKNIEALSIIAALLAFTSDIPNQQKKSHYEAWQVVSSACGHSGSGGRIKALQDLAEDGESLAGLFAKNAYLEKINLNGADLTSADFNKSNLKFSKFIDSDLSYAILDETDFSNANLSKADLSYTEFKSAYLSGAKLNGAILCFAKLNNTDLSYADLSNANLSDADLSNANLTYVKFNDTIIDFHTKIDDKWRIVWQIINQQANRRDFRNADFSRANLNDADLADAELSKANFRCAELCNVNFSNANLSGADLSSVNFYQPNLESVDNFKVWEIVNQKVLRRDFDSANLTKANLSGAIFSYAHLNYVKLKEAKLNNADFSNSDLSNANLRGADLSDTKIDQANIKNTDFTFAKNLTVNQVKSAKNWQSAIYDDKFRRKLDLPNENKN